MSAVISNSDPNTYLRAHADMEHDIPLADLLADPAGDKLPKIDAVFAEIMTIRGKRKAEEKQLARLVEEIAQLIREQRETEAYIGELRGKESALIERMIAEVRS
mgnify:FL=1|jgi:hypothetical protein